METTDIVPTTGGAQQQNKIAVPSPVSPPSAPAKLRVPAPADHIQVNFCKNPKCRNFGVPVSNKVQPRGRQGRVKKKRDTYTVRLGGASNVPKMVCSFCKQRPTTKSNAGISEEIQRFRAYLTPRIVSCPHPECANHETDVGYAREKGLGAYRAHGKTRAGTPRYKCRICNTVFSAPSKPMLRHKVSPDKDKLICSLIVNASPLKRITDVTGVSMPAVYDKIDFFRQQCLAFAASHESKFPRMNFKTLFLASDRQDYTLNWTVAEDKRNVIFKSVGTADLASGYVFALNVNFDPSLKPDEVEKDALAIGDYGLIGPFRRYARLWLEADYGPALERARQRRSTNRDRVLVAIPPASNTHSAFIRTAPDSSGPGRP